MSIDKLKQTNPIYMGPNYIGGNILYLTGAAIISERVRVLNFLF
jgi:hypothetical protein